MESRILQKLYLARTLLFNFKRRLVAVDTSTLWPANRECTTSLMHSNGVQRNPTQYTFKTVNTDMKANWPYRRVLIFCSDHTRARRTRWGHLSSCREQCLQTYCQPLWRRCPVSWASAEIWRVAWVYLKHATHRLYYQADEMPMPYVVHVQWCMCWYDTCTIMYQNWCEVQWHTSNIYIPLQILVETM